MAMFALLFAEHLRDNGYTVLESPTAKTPSSKPGNYPDLIITDDDAENRWLWIQQTNPCRSKPVTFPDYVNRQSFWRIANRSWNPVWRLSVKPSARELQVRVRNLIQLRKQLRARFSNAANIEPSEVSDLPLDQVFFARLLMPSNPAWAMKLLVWKTSPAIREWALPTSTANYGRCWISHPGNLSDPNDCNARQNCCCKTPAMWRNRLPGRFQRPGSFYPQF